MPEYEIHLPEPHDKQSQFIESPAKRKVIRAGRRGGKTVGMSIYAVQRFLEGRRVLYAAPTSEQIDRFWTTVSRALYRPIDAKVFNKNETEHVIELPGTEQRIRAKTAWNADSLRGDYADELILDEWQLMNEDAWGVVGAPMMLDNNGNATFVYTPPSLHSRSVSKATDPRHAAKLYKRASQDKTGRWATFNFTSHDNPYLSKEALSEITSDMTSLAYRMEIMAEDIEEAPGALWKRQNLDNLRVLKAPTETIRHNGKEQETSALSLVIVGVDPSATATGDEAGIVTAGMKGDQYYVLADDSIQGSPNVWAQAAVTAFYRHQANKIVAEANNGGEMVQLVINQIDANVPVELVHASRGKQTRAEPIAAIYEQGRAHHVGTFALLEDEMCLWMPGDNSPNRMDALVWAITKLSSGSNWVMS